ncbi:IclR family transcriptional regulator C-terminal domain-containing protein [Streptomyces sp. NPDC093225]|uniref:IclR family transcriptional regulator domain-containing protein n=1 Tax=Streptomyces sp. NPDC093225 TaxID=3366034 RepID=UPI0037F32E8F
MSERTETDPLDDLLRTAGPRRPARRSHADREAARARLMARPAPRREEDAAPVPFWPDPAAVDPVHPERAEAALTALTVAAVHAVKSASRLAVFASDRTLTAGALIFACVLHLADDQHGARFWWQYAAGADNRTAAYCLFLHHSAGGDYADAQRWADLAAPEGAPFTPEAWWGHGAAQPPHPAAYIRMAQHTGLASHAELGDIPLPAPRIAKDVLAVAPPPAPWDYPLIPGGWMVHRGRREKPTPLTAPNRRRRKPRTPHTAPSVPQLVTGAPPSPPSAPGTSQALKEARRALAVVRVLQDHRLGVETRQISQETGLPEATLTPILEMLCEEEFADPITDTVFAPGLALDRLALPVGAGVAAQLQRTLAITRQEIGAAIYLGQYAQGDIRITQASTADTTPPVHEYIPFRYAGHATAVGKCLLGQLDPAGQADHVSRYKTEAFTERTIASPRVLLERLSRLRPGAPVYDAFEYGPDWCCSAVPVSIGGEAGSLALSLPAEHIHRLGDTTQQLRRKAVPIMLTLLLTGEIPAEGPAAEADSSPLVRTTDDGIVTAGGLMRLRRMFTKAVINAAAVRTAVQVWSGPHLVTDESSLNVYYFDAAPGPTRTGTTITLPQTLTVPPSTDRSRLESPSGWGRPTAHALGELTVYRT